MSYRDQSVKGKIHSRRNALLVAFSTLRIRESRANALLQFIIFYTEG